MNCISNVKPYYFIYTNNSFEIIYIQNNLYKIWTWGGNHNRFSANKNVLFIYACMHICINKASNKKKECVTRHYIKILFCTKKNISINKYNIHREFINGCEYHPVSTFAPNTLYVNGHSTWNPYITFD